MCAEEGRKEGNAVRSCDFLGRIFIEGERRWFEERGISRKSKGVN